ncbi:MAG: hypothetical protein JWQ04_98 [Pedosphaera sp.]|nr:hypothetical protein [Pedosphaera sp.]
MPECRSACSAECQVPKDTPDMRTRNARRTRRAWSAGSPKLKLLKGRVRPAGRKGLPRPVGRAKRGPYL